MRRLLPRQADVGRSRTRPDVTEAPSETIYEEEVYGTVHSIDEENNVLDVRIEKETGMEIRRISLEEVDKFKVVLEKGLEVRVSSSLDILPPSPPMGDLQVREWHEKHNLGNYQKEAKPGRKLLKNVKKPSNSKD